MNEIPSCRARRGLLLAAALLPLAPARAAGAALPQLSLFGSSSKRVEGSGRLIDDARPATGFTRLILQAPLDVRLRAAAADGIVVRADDNIAPLIETQVKDGTLTIGLRPGASFRTHGKIVITVQARRIDAVVLRGSGDLRADRIETDVFEATLQGSGDIAIERLAARAVAVSVAGNGDFRAAGSAETLGVVIDGSGDVHCFDLPARQVAVRIRGSGDARVHATGELKVDIDGSGDVRYRGSPQVSRAIRGSGSVEPSR